MTANPIHAQSQASRTLRSDSSPPDLASLPPLSFSFTFYAPLGVPPAQYFYSEEPLQRTNERMVEFDEEEWGDQVGLGSDEKEEVRDEEDPINEFIRGAIEEGEQGESDSSSSKDRGGGGGRKRKNESEDRHSSSGDGKGSNAVRKRIRHVSPSPVERRGRSPRVERASSASANPSSFPYPRTLGTSVSALRKYVTYESLSPFLTSDRPPPSASDEYGSTLIRFFKFVENPSTWVPREHLSVLQPRTVSKLSLKVRGRLPDFHHIQENFQPGTCHYLGGDPNGDPLRGNNSLAFKTAAWLWGRYVRAAELRWIVEIGPLPLFILRKRFPSKHSLVLLNALLTVRDYNHCKQF